MTMRRIDTVWEVWAYDVWGNARDGFDVNDRACIAREYPIRCAVNRHNVGTEREFEAAAPSSRQIREALGLTGYKRGIDTDGDDLTVYVNLANGYPAGELHCISHESLSPIRAKS